MSVYTLLLLPLRERPITGREEERCLVRMCALLHPLGAPYCWERDQRMRERALLQLHVDITPIGGVALGQLHNGTGVMAEVMAVSVEVGGPQEPEDERESECLVGES